MFSGNKRNWTFQQQNLYCEIYFQCVVKLYCEEEYREALEMLDRFEASVLKDFKVDWSPERRRKIREDIFMSMNRSSEGSSRSSQKPIELENLIETEKEAERIYHSQLLEADNGSYDMIKPYKWYSWKKRFDEKSAEELEQSLINLIHANWRLEHFECASRTALMWMELQPEDSVGHVRAQVILVDCFCHQKCYVSAMRQLIGTGLYYLKNANETSLEEFWYSTNIGAYDIIFWKQRVTEL